MKVKTTVIENGQKIIKEVEASSIVREPNGHQVESIIKALTVVVTELFDHHEQSKKRLEELYQEMSSPDQLQLHVDE